MKTTKQLIRIMLLLIMSTLVLNCSNDSPTDPAPIGTTNLRHPQN